MCGIQLQVWTEQSSSRWEDFYREHGSILRNRGPDHCQMVDATKHFYSCRSVQLRASVLQMRHELIPQPVQIKDDMYLCWNGEIYESNLPSSQDEEQHEELWEYETSDTLIVKEALKVALLEQTIGDDIDDGRNIGNAIAQVMSKLHNAEFACLILTKDNIYYCRDNWGRRSLLRWNCPDGSGSFQIASTAEISTSDAENKSYNQDDKEEKEDGQEWTEIPPGAVYRIHIGGEDGTMSTSVIPFSSSSSLLSPPSSNSILPSVVPPTPPDGVSTELWQASFVLEDCLRQAVKMRLDQHAPSAVLFSGGLDSAVVAALAAAEQTATSTADQKHQQLYLYNVSFGPTFEKSNDRKAALVTAGMLKDRYQDTKDILFQDIVVDWEDIQKYEPHIRTLLQPKNTLMDVNIGIALWFASRGSVDGDENDVYPDGENRIRSPRALLLGMGADEQLGGYGRHRKAFDKGGWGRLKEELDMDQARFWERNLGRDDRICADHGKEARFPFLDANVVNFLKGLPLDQICDFSLPPGEGDKRILRLVAARLGLDHASGLVKRAIQFGSRISHLSDAKRFGSRRKAKGEASVKSK
ncbi:unnamed protein product [Cylindrotheca closterium]|uniref:Asparagine synthetase domain-containing protein n=1 Tax=Cylindrotheca closterium TaxID=2856 RepID=A0AAD2FDL6_9STRA|nr:unnamed protein product [Cylindrotheca closterium]